MYRIKKEALEFILGVSKSLHPREFIGLLRGEGKTITEVIVLPGSLYGEGFSSYQPYLAPLDNTIVGSVHSHPNASNLPSHGDLHAFNKKGGVNIIVKYPYLSREDMDAYDAFGMKVEVDVV